MEDVTDNQLEEFITDLEMRELGEKRLGETERFVLKLAQELRRRRASERIDLAHFARTG